MAAGTWLPSLLLLAAGGLAQNPPPPSSNALKNLGPALLSGGGNSLDSLAGAVRGQLVRNLPPVLYQASPGWGRTARVPNGLKWRGRHLPLRPEVQFALKNDGTWRHVLVTAPNLADTLILDLRNLHHAEAGRMTFDVYLAFDGRFDITQQKWESGVKLWDAALRARARLRLLLSCEAIAQLEPNGGLMPDAVFRLRVTAADLQYDNVVVDHLAGIGGDAAQILGDALRGALRQWRPSLERELREKANAAIVKAGDTKEVRVNLLALFRSRGNPSKPASK